MAAPVIDSVTPPGPLTLAPGQTVTFNVAAHDPDTRNGTATFSVSDSQGNVTPVQVAVSVSDPLIFTASTTVGTLTQDTVVASRWVLTV
jgi:hypothetical protein